MGVEEGGLGSGNDERWVGGCEGGVGKVCADFGDEVEGEREGIEDGGDEGCSAAECFGDNEVVVEEDVVAVIADDEATVGNGFGICNHYDGVLWIMCC